MSLHYYLRFMVFCTFLLLVAGGLVTSTDSGLAVPDWPKSYGMWMPPMVGGVLYEHGHRMVAAFVGFLTVILAIWMGFKEKRRWVRNLGFAALAAVITQGILGGITVKYFLPAPVSVTHATLAQSFFTLLVCLALFTSRGWRDDYQERATSVSVSGRSNIPGAWYLATAIGIYLQLILGATVRHTDAALAIPDFPLAFGRIIPEFATAQIAIQFAHRMGALAVLALVITTFIKTWKVRDHLMFFRPALLLQILVLIQIGLGAWTVLSRTAVPVATAHVVTGAAMLATSVLLTIRSYRVRQLETSRAFVPAGNKMGFISAEGAV